MNSDFTAKVFENWLNNHFNNKIIINYDNVLKDLSIICNNGNSSNFLLEQLCFLKSCVSLFKNDISKALKEHFYNSLSFYQLKTKYFKCDCEICNYFTTC